MSYILAKSQNDDILKAGECGGAVTSIFKYLLDEGLVDGVLALSPLMMYMMLCLLSSLIQKNY
jgi:formate dehydrogenase subunit beta